jgi:hypothetical protein
VFQSGVPCARHRQAQSNPSCLPVNRSKRFIEIAVVARHTGPRPGGSNNRYLNRPAIGVERHGLVVGL